MLTCVHCFRELADVRVDLGSGQVPAFCHRRCLEAWATADEGEWFLDGDILWASWLSGNMARIVSARNYVWYQVFNSRGVVGQGRADSLLLAQIGAERMAA